jgi:polyisoprenoid-binding protein YceI
MISNLMRTSAGRVGGSYVLDPVHSSFGFAIEHNGVYRFHGRFREVEAKLEGGVLTGTAQVASIETAMPAFTAQLLAPHLFDAERAPTIEFRSTELRVAEDGRVEVEGELTLRGVTREIAGTGTFARGEGLKGEAVAGLELEATIDRRDFGLDWQAQLPSGGDLLGWDVTIEIQLHLMRS